MYFYVVAKYKRPRIHLEDPHRLTVPIVISRYKQKPPITVNRSTEKRWPFSSERKAYNTPARQTAICKWIRKKRALRQLKAAREREKQRLRDILRREREIELIEQLQKQQQYQIPDPEIVVTKKVRPPKPVVIKKKKETKKQLQQYQEPEPKIVIPPPKALSPPPAVIKKEKKIKPKKETRLETWRDTTKETRKEKPKGKSTFAKPKAESKVVSVKKYCYHQTLTERFVGFCYRCCCQLYCCLTILLLIGFAIVLLI